MDIGSMTHIGEEKQFSGCHSQLVGVLGLDLNFFFDEHRVRDRGAWIGTSAIGADFYSSGDY
jgi:hypothetical protein